jgi:hypothetical protein
LDYVEIKTRKPKQANWENSKVLAIINAKKVEHEASLEVVDSRDNMETTITKWKHISINGIWCWGPPQSIILQK